MDFLRHDGFVFRHHFPTHRKTFDVLRAIDTGVSMATSVHHDSGCFHLFRLPGIFTQHDVFRAKRRKNDTPFVLLREFDAGCDLRFLDDLHFNDHFQHIAYIFPENVNRVGRSRQTH